MKQSFNKFGEPLIKGSTSSDSYTKDQADFNFLEDNSNIDLNNKFKIMNLPDPEDGYDATNKNYVDEGDSLATQRSRILAEKLTYIQNKYALLEQEQENIRNELNSTRKFLRGEIPAITSNLIYTDGITATGISEFKQMIVEKADIDTVVSKTVSTDKLKTKELEVEGNWLNEETLKQMFTKIDNNEKSVVQMIYAILLESDLIDDKSEIEKKFKFKTEDKYRYISDMFPSK